MIEWEKTKHFLNDEHLVFSRIELDCFSMIKPKLSQELTEEIVKGLNNYND